MPVAKSKTTGRTVGRINPDVSYADPTDAQEKAGKRATVYLSGSLQGYIVATPAGRFQFLRSGSRDTGPEMDTVDDVKRSLEAP